MRWTERQRAMLREMGVHLWAREEAAIAPVAVADAVVAERVEVPSAVAPAPASARAAPARPVHAAEPEPARATVLAPADWLIVGEAFDGADPQQEQLLDNMLRAIGLGRTTPARARRASYLVVGAAPPAGAASDLPVDALDAAIAAVAPRCILALGRAGAAAVLGSDVPLAQWRGRCHERATLPVVVTFSLAFLLRHPADKAKAWADLCLAVGAIAA